MPLRDERDAALRNNRDCGGAWRMKRLVAVAIVGGLSLAGVASGQTLLYSNTFSTPGFGAEWTGTELRHTDAVNFGGFNGRYSGSDFVVLSLRSPLGPNDNSVPPGPGNGIRYTLTFDLNVIDSWDGNDTRFGPDRFITQINAVTLFDQTFANTGATQSFRGPDVGRSHLGFSPQWQDSIYRDISISAVLPRGVNPWFTWYASGLQGLHDESWGIDNVRVSYEVIPSPGVLAPGGVGLLALARRRRG
jgi:hypothetical protein